MINASRLGGVLFWILWYEAGVDGIRFERQKYWRSRYVLSVGRDGLVVARIPAGWGEDKVAAILHKHRRWLVKRAEERAIRSARDAQRAQFDAIWCELTQDWYKKAAKIILTRLCEQWSVRMGVSYGAIRITGARTRWGSCSVRGNLSFSWKLLRTRWDLMEYVVVHELAHRVHFNHGKRFWALVAKHVPDVEARRADLRGLGGELGEDLGQGIGHRA